MKPLRTLFFSYKEKPSLHFHFIFFLSCETEVCKIFPHHIRHWSHKWQNSDLFTLTTNATLWTLVWDIGVTTRRNTKLLQTKVYNVVLCRVQCTAIISVVCPIALASGPIMNIVSSIAYLTWYVYQPENHPFTTDHSLHYMYTDIHCWSWRLTEIYE